MCAYVVDHTFIYQARRSEMCWYVNMSTHKYDVNELIISKEDFDKMFWLTI